MFLTAPDFTIEDFVKACGMIAPQGTTIEMIISPEPLGLPSGSGFTPQDQVADVPEDESIVYQRTEPVLKQTAAPTPSDYSVWEAKKLGRTIPTPNITPPITDPESLPSPFIKVLSESTVFGFDIQLREDWACFPKNTVFQCQPSKLSEGILSARINQQKAEDKKRHSHPRVFPGERNFGPGSTSKGSSKEELDNELEMGLIDYQEYTRKCRQLGIKEAMTPKAKLEQLLLDEFQKINDNWGRVDVFKKGDFYVADLLDKDLFTVKQFRGDTISELKLNAMKWFAKQPKRYRESIRYKILCKHNGKIRELCVLRSGVEAQQAKESFIKKIPPEKRDDYQVVIRSVKDEEL